MGKWEDASAFHEDAGLMGAFADLDAVRVNMTDPAVSERQRRYMGAELARRRRGEATETDMSEAQLRDFARKKKRK